APVRVGQPPKLLLLYRVEAPFEKITSRRFTSSGGRTHRIEFLGVGQQFIGYGLHPDTGKSYRWGTASPLNTAAANLTAVTNEQVQEFIPEAEQVLLRLGFEPVEGAATITTVVGSAEVVPFPGTQPAVFA